MTHLNSYYLLYYVCQMDFILFYLACVCVCPQVSSDQCHWKKSSESWLTSVDHSTANIHEREGTGVTFIASIQNRKRLFFD